MRVKQFNQEGTLELREVKNTVQTNMYTKIFTDGEIVNIGEPEVRKFDNISIFENRDGFSTYTSRTVQLKNHTYAVVYTIAKEFLKFRNGRGGGWYDVIKGVTVYTTNKKDRTALKKARKTMQMVAEHANSINYASLLEMMLSDEAESKVLEYTRTDDYVYTLKNR